MPPLVAREGTFSTAPVALDVAPGQRYTTYYEVHWVAWVDQVLTLTIEASPDGLMWYPLVSAVFGPMDHRPNPCYLGGTHTSANGGGFVRATGVVHGPLQLAIVGGTA